MRVVLILIFAFQFVENYLARRFMQSTEKEARLRKPKDKSHWERFQLELRIRPVGGDCLFTALAAAFGQRNS